VPEIHNLFNPAANPKITAELRIFHGNSTTVEKTEVTYEQQKPQRILLPNQTLNVRISRDLACSLTSQRA
jgi:hypothetical protein